MGVPLINFLGVVDDGNGNYSKGLNVDADHPNNLGHEEMYLSIIPSFIQTVYKGKAIPVLKKTDKHITLDDSEKNQAITYYPDGEVHSFTMAVSFRAKTKGKIAGILTPEFAYSIQILDNSIIVISDDPERKIKSKTMLLDGNWHTVLIRSRYIKKEISIFIDGINVGAFDAKILPIEFQICTDNGPVDFKDFIIYRSALNDDEVEALNAGKLPRGSLEVYSPMNDRYKRGNQVENLALNSKSPIFSTGDLSERNSVKNTIRMNEDKRQKTKALLASKKKKEFIVDVKLLKEYCGKYELKPPGVVFTISTDDEKLYLADPGGGKVELAAKSVQVFTVNSPGMNVEIKFERNKEGIIDKFIILDGKDKIPVMKKSN